ncbi:MAG: response regulator transcription factor [Pseudomonadota bacterium]
MKAKHVAVIEDEEDILELIRYNLRREGYEVSGYSSGEIGVENVRNDPPNLVLLDLMLPGVDGLEVCKQLKSDAGTRDIPIIMISAKGEESDIVSGLELGADDYIAKPFSTKILIARVRAVLRRRQSQEEKPEQHLKIHDLEMDAGRFQASLAGTPLSLTHDEFKLLLFLARHPGWVFTRYQIVDGIKGEDYVVTERAVDVRIVGLRKKLGDNSNYIETVRGVGYRFKES